jgi:glycosyltransferase involved in cell wall biosynthesis
MNYYILPSIGIYGGVKVGFQFAELLSSLSIPIAVATLDGSAPQWFSASIAVANREETLARLRVSDVVLFSLPHDYPELKATGARLVFHCQGTDPLILPIIRDREVTLLTCWQQARSFVEKETGRRPIEVGISISDCFFYGGAPKVEAAVAYMPRRGADIAEEAIRGVAGLDFLAIQHATEAVVAAKMKRAGYFLATSEGEWFGLPALEAMAAGCVVVSVPTIGGSEFLRDGESALVAARDDLLRVIANISRAEARGRRAQLRAGAIAVAARYRRSLQRAHLLQCLRGPLGASLSWT